MWSLCLILPFRPPRLCLKEKATRWCLLLLLIASHARFPPSCFLCLPQRDALTAKQPANRSSIKAEDFKKFVAKLRIKSNDYKTKKQEVVLSWKKGRCWIEEEDEVILRTIRNQVTHTHIYMPPPLPILHYLIFVTHCVLCAARSFSLPLWSCGTALLFCHDHFLFLWVAEWAAGRTSCFGSHGGDTTRKRRGSACLHCNCLHGV